MILETETFLIEYSYFGKEYCCQIEAYNKSEAQDIFKHKFENFAVLNKIQTIEEYASEISNKIFDEIKKDLNK